MVVGVFALVLEVVGAVTLAALAVALLVTIVRSALWLMESRPLPGSVSGIRFEAEAARLDKDEFTQDWWVIPVVMVNVSHRPLRVPVMWRIATVWTGRRVGVLRRRYSYRGEFRLDVTSLPQHERYMNPGETVVGAVTVSLPADQSPVRLSVAKDDGRPRPGIRLTGPVHTIGLIRDPGRTHVS
ncbi:MAG TPA: hypothetical protein VFQ96_04225 [Microbacteriaceae bacterium]|nr:hypothetical protein [Microbacteriaceae bacterium]